MLMLIILIIIALLTKNADQFEKVHTYFLPLIFDIFIEEKSTYVVSRKLIHSFPEFDILFF